MLLLSRNEGVVERKRSAKQSFFSVRNALDGSRVLTQSLIEKVFRKSTNFWRSSAVEHLGLDVCSLTVFVPSLDFAWFVEWTVLLQFCE